MIRTLIAALLVAGAAVLPATAHAKKRKAEKPMEWKGQQGPMEAAVETVADAKAWERLWLKIGQDAPDLDFKKFVAVAVFAGEKPTGGFVVEFADTAPAPDGGIKVKWRLKAPDGFASQAFAQPWKVRAFPRPRGAVVVEGPVK